MQHGKARVTVVSMAFLFSLGLGLRLFYGTEVLRQFENLSSDQRASYEIGYLTPDSRGYLELAGRLLNGQDGGYYALLRPVGYPAFLALLGMKPVPILVVQSILLSLIPVCTFLLVSLITGRRTLALVAGLFACLSPTGVAIGSLLGPDGLVAVFFSMAFLGVSYGAVRESWTWITVSALLSGVAILLKPIMMYWPLVSIVVFLLLHRSFHRPQAGRFFRFNRTAALVLFLIPMLPLAAGALANRSNNGIFTFSEIGSLTTRVYLGVEVEEWAKAGGRPEESAIRGNQAEVRARFGALSRNERWKAYRDEGMAILKEHPFLAMRAFLENVLENSRVGWNRFAKQLPFSYERIGSVFAKITAGERVFRTALFVLVILAPFAGWGVARARPSPQNRAALTALFAMTLTVLYFALPSGITFWTGPRITYPMEMVQLSVIATLLSLEVRKAPAG